MRIPALLLIASFSVPAVAGETPWQELAPGAKARLISSDVLKADGTTMVGLELDMPTTLNTYWRVPGETGIPTQFDFGGSSGVAGHETLWPEREPADEERARLMAVRGIWLPEAE